MRLRIAIALAIVLSAISPAPGISSAAVIDVRHDGFHHALSHVRHFSHCPWTVNAQ